MASIKKVKIKYKNLIKNPPLKPYVITSEYGVVRKLDYKQQKIHTGIDFVGWNGKNYITTDILATVEGTIIFAKQEKFDILKSSWGGRGNNITIQCKEDKNVFVHFYHLEKIYVKEGQIVNPMTKIGYMGNSGHSFGAHLHYEVKIVDGNYKINRGIAYPSQHINPDKFYIGDFNLEQKNIDEKQYEVLKKGMEGIDVIFLQDLLNRKGYRLIIDGIFSEITQEIVKNYQEKNNLKADGIVGKNTWNLLLKG